jgi:hypothetical protein
MSIRFRSVMVAAIAAVLFAISVHAQLPQKTIIRNSTVSANAPISTAPYAGSVWARTGSGQDGKP